MKKSNINICNTDIAKSFNEEKRIFKCVVLRPNQYDDDGVFSDYYSEETVEKACHDFMMFCNQANDSHEKNTDLVKFVENSIADVDYTLGEGVVKTGDWVAAVKVFSDDIWDKCKKGTYTGFSIGCKAYVEEVE